MLNIVDQVVYISNEDALNCFDTKKVNMKEINRLIWKSIQNTDLNEIQKSLLYFIGYIGNYHFIYAFYS